LSIIAVKKGINVAKKTVLILLGPTCVGKTGASLLLAKALDTEIISADSMQIYRYMDIGTAKPVAQERALVKHHMIDIVAPSEPFSTGKYVASIIPIIDELHRKEMIPLVVGGTGLYIKAMTRGIFSGPAADWELRENLLAMEEKSSGSLYAYLQKLDREAASRIMPSDIRRIIRALEVCLMTETGISELQERRTVPLPYKFIKIGLTRERGELCGLIEKRTESMISRGLVNEVKSLLLMNPGRTALQAIGYKEIAAHLRGEYSLDEAVRLIKKRTKNYAKRQVTWFKTEPDIRWFDITGFSTHEKVQRTIALLLKML
jgi:tRNA dimethylallyltransferase